jgi:hypothetical protein
LAIINNNIVLLTDAGNQLVNYGKYGSRWELDK